MVKSRPPSIATERASDDFSSLGARHLSRDEVEALHQRLVAEIQAAERRRLSAKSLLVRILNVISTLTDGRLSRRESLNLAEQVALDLVKKRPKHD